MRTVLPVRPVAPYIGGKRNLARRLVSVIEQTPHDSYAEVFVGMGGIFLRRRQAPRAEAINDFGRDVATLFRILQRHYVPFLDMMRYQLTTRVEFERLAATDPATLTDLERAARFLFLQRTAFGGKVSGRTFGVSPGVPARFDVTKLVPMLEGVHDRLAGVVIECLPYGEFIRRYDRSGALFYLDPPYHGSEDDYGKELFTPADHARLAEQRRKVKGRFVLSINDRPDIRRLYRSWARLEPVETTYTVAGFDKAKRARELIITGGRA